MKRHYLTQHAYADDTQIYGHCQPSCWMGCRLHRRGCSVEEGKSTATESRQNRGPLVRLFPTSTLGPDRIGSCQWCLSVTGHCCSDLGVYIDTDVTMRTHVINTIRSCFSALHQIWSVRRSLPQHTLLTLVHALVITKLDHCNSIHVGTAGYLQNRLQSALNATAWLTYSHRASEHTTPLLWDLHWLRIPERIQFRLCVLAYHCLHWPAWGNWWHRSCWPSDWVIGCCSLPSLRRDNRADEFYKVKSQELVTHPVSWSRSKPIKNKQSSGESWCRR